MSDDIAGICGNTIAALTGDPLVCALPAGHDGWHSCDQIFTGAPLATATLTSTVSRCHWTNTAPTAGGDPIAAAEQRGYDKAIARLRYGQRIADRAWQANTAALDVSLRIAADYLEAVKETPDHA